MKNEGNAFYVSLKACRTNANLSQKQMAEKLGVNRTTVLNWEKGKTSPTGVQLIRISKLSGVPVDHILIPVSLQK